MCRHSRKFPTHQPDCIGQAVAAVKFEARVRFAGMATASCAPKVITSKTEERINLSNIVFEKIE